MLYFHGPKLVVLCQPKTATTALHDAISGYASVAFNNPANLKHLTYRAFIRMFREKLETGGEFRRRKFTFVAVMREPTDWFGSWYRFKQRKQVEGTGKWGHRSTEGVSYNQFLETLLLPLKERPTYSQIATPSMVSLSSPVSVGVDYLFSYSDLDQMVDFVSRRIGREIVLPKANVSERQKLEADPELLVKLRDRYGFDYNLYDALRPDGTVPSMYQKLHFKALNKDDASLGGDNDE